MFLLKNIYTSFGFSLINSGFALANTKNNPACPEFVIHNLFALIIKSSPSFFATAFIPNASLPEPASDKQKQPIYLKE